MSDVTVDRIKSVIADMDERDQLILNSYFYNDITLTQMAKDMGVSRQWIHQLKNRALGRAWDMAVGRKCYRCNKMHKISYRAAGREKVKCPRCGERMDRIPGRNLPSPPAAESSWA